MNSFAWLRRWPRRWWSDTARGQGLVEYALILALVAIVVIGSLTLVGKKTSQVFDRVNCTIAGGEWHQDNGNGNSNRCR
jgi:pilus assembly protein Flp/PilA